MKRILGKIEGDLPGPLVICVAAVHGNEQVGIHAFRNVYAAIKNHDIPFRGKFIGILGNTKAIESNRRFIDYDLNRSWTKQNIDRIINQNGNEYAEDEELKAIYEIIEDANQGTYTTKILADLHSTSSEKGNFIVIPEDTSNEPVIKALQLPTIVDIHEYLEGTLLEYYHNKGFISFAFEGGMIGTEGVYQLHTSGLWELLDKCGCIGHHDHEVEDHYFSQLESVSKDLPKRVKVRHCHKVKKEDGFRMLPGFHNFQKIHKGQLLAFSHEQEIQAPTDGMIFMPLYQAEGEDGFFIVEEETA